MSSNLNVKTLNIDVDRALSIVSPTNPSIGNINFVRGNEYTLQANCYAYSNVASTFDEYDTFELYLGRTYESNAHPVVCVTDPTRWNNVASWADVNVAAGMICCEANVDGTALTADLGNADSQTYQMEIVLTNNSGGKVIICDTRCIVNNAVQI